MKRLLLLEFRKNRKSVFLYLAALAAVLYQGLGMVGEDFAAVGGREAFLIIGRNLFTTYLLSGAVLSYIIVKDFEVGTIKEYFFVGYTRREIYWVKYCYLLCEGSGIINLAVAGGVLWKSLKNGYGGEVSGGEIGFWARGLIGNIVGCFFIFAASLLCIIVVGNALALVLYFVGISFLDVIALVLVETYGAPEWISVRKLIGAVCDRAMPFWQYMGRNLLLLGAGGILLAVGQKIFSGKEYR